MNLSYRIKIFVQAIEVLTIYLQPATMQAQFAGGNGTSDSPYQISTPAQLASLASIINAEKSAFKDNHYILTSDIDLSEYSATNTNFNNGNGWIPIGIAYITPFNGIFDGNGKKITGLYINSDNNLVGLFGYLTGIVKNLGLEEVNITGENDVGGLAGMLYSGIIVNCYVSGNIKGVDQVGGLVGYICFSEMDNCYTLGSVSGKKNVGGLVGCSTNGKIRSCAALNSSVEATNATSVRRVAGFYAGSLTELNNIAFSEMKVWSRSSLLEPVNDDPNYLADGKGCTAAEIVAAKFFENFFVHTTSNDDPWTYDEGKLPGFGKAVNMPDYFIFSKF